MNKIVFEAIEKIKSLNEKTVVVYLLDNIESIDSLADCIEKFHKIKITKAIKSKVKIANSDTRRFGVNEELIIFKNANVDEKFTPDFFRNYFAGLINEIANDYDNIIVSLPSFTSYNGYFFNEEYFIQTMIEGFELGNYKFDKYLSEKKSSSVKIFFMGNDNRKIKSAIKNAADVMSGVLLARNLTNEPPNVLYPNELANRVKSVFTKTKVKVTVFDEKELMKRKMGGILAVGNGSSNPPSLIIMEYNGSKKGDKPIALIGKGLTFDTGGISIKPAQNMGEMKGDMAGAAAVIGTILSVSKAKLPVNIVGVIPSAENMLSGKSFRPGDIVTTSSGKTIEIDNTDAEGRVALTDAIHFANQKNPKIMIDLATLTGACVVALGEAVAGLFTKNDQLAKELFKSGLHTYERVWQMPMWDDYHKLNKSKIADVKNLGGRWGGAISAAKFLENWVDKNVNWAHIDIAGPSGQHDATNYTKDTMTGFGVRLLFDFISSYAG